MSVNKGQSAKQEKQETAKGNPAQPQHDYFAGSQEPAGMGGSEAPSQGFETYSDLDAVFSTPVSMTGAGDCVVAYREAFETSMKEDLRIGKRYGTVYQAHGLSRQSNRLPTDMVVLTTSSKTGVHFFTMLLSASLSNETVRQEQYMGHSYTCYQTPSELYDEAALEEVKRFLTSTFGDVALTEVGFTVVPTKVQPDNANGISTLMANAINAMAGYMNRNNKQALLTSQRLAAWGGIGTTMRFTKEPVAGINSQPNRTDLTISLSVSEGRQQNGFGQQHQQPRERKLIRASGFVDLTRNPPQMVPGQGFQFGMQQSASPEGAYTARLIVSNLEQVEAANSLELSLLALASCEMAAANNAWRNSFTRQYDNDASNLHDIGGVGLEVNLMNQEQYAPERLNTLDNAFDANALNGLLNYITTPGLILALDIEEGGSQMWLLRQFSKAANGDSESPQATQAIFQAANNLTSNLFSQNFPAGQPIVKTDNVRVHLGRYVNEDNVTCDIRDIDHLAVLNTSQAGDLTTSTTWRESFDERYPGTETVRLAGREGVIRGIAQNVEFTGMARRITFNPAFIGALQMSLNQAGVSLNANTGGNGMGQQAPIYTDMSSYAMGVGQHVNAFNYVNRQPQPQQGGYTGRNRFM